MANVIKHKRGSGSDPVANDLVVGEVAIRTDVGKLFTKMDNGSVAEIAGGGSDIAINTLSSSSATGGGSATFNGSAYRFTLSAPPNVSAAQLLVSINGVIQKPVAGTGQPSEGFSVDGTDIILGDAPATGSDFFILTFKSLGVSEPADNSVTSAKIVDGTIVNADINASAAIAGTKIDPSFTSNVTISNTAPRLDFIDSNNNSDFRITNSNGLFVAYDITNAATRFSISSNGTVNIPGTLTSSGKLQITQNTSTIPEIELNGLGPNFIRFTDAGNAAHSLDLVFRDSPNTLGIEKSSDGTALFTVDSDDGLVTVANDLKVDGDIRLLSDGSNPVLKVTGAGPNFITFASDASGTVDADSINLVYRTSPNTLGYERASDATVLFQVDADNGQANFPFNLDVGGGLDVTGVITATGNIDIPDNAKLKLGTGDDLQIYHSGFNYIESHNDMEVHINAYTGGAAENMAKFKPNGAVELYHNGTKKFQTDSDGVEIFGNRLRLADNVKAAFGSGADLQIFHDGNHSRISDEGTGSLLIQSNGGNIQLNKGTSENMLVANTDGSVELYHNNSKKFETTSGGVQVTDNLNMSGGHIFLADNYKLNVGTGDDLQIYHESGDSHITNSVGNLDIINSTNGWIRLQPKSGEEGVIVKYDGAVELYYDNVKKFETNSDGVLVTRNTSDTNMTNTSQLVLRNTNDGANTFAGIRFEVSSNTNTDHFIVQKKHSGGSGTDLIIGHGSNERLRFIESGGFTFNGDTAAANALDDYEEGTWTPTLPSGASATLVGQYTKIGNKVFWALQINSLSGSASFQISGLPYTVGNGWGGNISISNNNHSPEHIYVFAHNGSSDIYFRNDSNVTFNTSTFSGKFFYCNGFYQV